MTHGRKQLLAKTSVEMQLASLPRDGADSRSLKNSHRWSQHRLLRAFSIDRRLGQDAWQKTLDGGAASLGPRETRVERKRTRAAPSVASVDFVDAHWTRQPQGTSHVKLLRLLWAGQ
ncbi:hypothetical protein EUGRSUZ_B00012 [Eucalyptus grandis]|uniref:Uncharacterized protein n=2 Tax=Eucalyptus grandis TaxID=71139 RepID=A0ACC3KIJ9_EUCGR|nr:hypothetical protein EUGRSUZ_B00012 [Eucalyptus grandis]